MAAERIARGLRASARGALCAWLTLIALALLSPMAPVGARALLLLPGAAAFLPLACFVLCGLLIGWRVPGDRGVDARPVLRARGVAAVLAGEVALWWVISVGLLGAVQALVPLRFAHRASIARVALTEVAVVIAVAAVALITRRIRAYRFPFWTFAPLHLLSRLYIREDIALVWPGHDFALELISALLCVLAAGRWGERTPSARELKRALPPMLVSLVLTLGYAALRPAALSLLLETFPGPAGALAQLGRAYDLDGDGFSAVFGGADCDDADPLISPMALERVGNGVDDNCMGGDLASYSPPGPTRRAIDVPRRNLILIVVDALRADAVGHGKQPALYNGTAPALRGGAPMPNVDRWSRQGALFERAYAQAPYTGQAMRSLMTGYYPMSLNTFEVNLGMEPSLAKRLRSVGYLTSAIAQFDEVKLGSRAQKATSNLLTDFERVDWSLREQNADFRGVTSPETTRRALAELARLRADGRPFFLWLHYFDPHAEYMAHDGTPFSADTLAGRYWQEVFATDRALAPLFAELEQSGYFKDGYLAFTADHGELLGEHEHFQHSYWLDDEALRVPLVVRGPGVPVGRFSPRVRSIDLAPTLWSIAAGMDAPAAGRSLAEVWSGREQGDRDVVAISTYDRRVIKRAVLHDDWKLELDLMNGVRALRKLDRAGGVSADVALDHPDVELELEQRLGRIWDQAMNDRFLARRHGRR